MKRIDLTYLKDGLFTAFFPENESGEKAWRELANITQGTGKIPTIQLGQFLQSLKKAGYSVKSIKSN